MSNTQQPLNQQELLNTQRNAEETPSQNSSLIEREELPNTPFTLITTQKGVFITMGKYMLVPKMKNKEEALLYLEFHKWEIIANMACCIAELIHDNRAELEMHTSITHVTDEAIKVEKQ